VFWGFPAKAIHDIPKFDAIATTTAVRFSTLASCNAEGDSDIQGSVTLFRFLPSGKWRLDENRYVEC
jgi:hypothetical protein